MPAKIDGRTKKAIIRFIAKFGGHGAISAASRKFEVSRVTIMRWLKSEPTVKGKGKAKVGRPPKAAAKIGKPRKVRKAPNVAKAPVAAKVAKRRRRPAKAGGMKAFAKGLIAIAELQAMVGEAMMKLAAFVE